MRDDHGMDSHDRKLLDDVEQHGWHVLKILADENGPQFCYSVGMYHSLRHPEIITFGLDLMVGHRLINEAGRLAREGKPVPVGRQYDGLLEGFPVIFKPVAKEHYRNYFGYALWFYRSDEFDALQCIWPDRDNRWPWEEKFNPHWKPQQPLLQ